MIRILSLLAIFLLSFSPARAQWDWHIGGGMVVDGSGAPAFRADILVRGDSIGYVGRVDPDTVEAAQYMDATGLVVAPGFIDLHTHGDPQSTPQFRNFLAMGVTTVVMGQDGSSPGDGTMVEWFVRVERARPAVNVAALTGHGSLRAQIVPSGRAASAGEIRQMAALLKQDLLAGAWGMSTGLEYIPGIWAEPAELQKMAEVVGEYGGIIMSHLRSEDDRELKSSLDELAEQGRYARVHVSHLKSVYGKGAERAEEILGYIDEYRSQGIPMTADTYPYTASYTGISIVFPGWAKTREQWRFAMDQRPDELRRYVADKVRERNGPEAILFGSGNYAGKTLQDVADEQGYTFVELLMSIGPQAASAAHFVMDEALQDRIAVDPQVMIASDGSHSMHHPRGYGSFARVIRRYVTEQQVLSLEQAVYKMSGAPAATLGLEQRGLIRTGYKADLLVFDPEKVRDTATWEEPHRLAEGFDWIWVNGRNIRRDGRFSELRNGEVLRHRTSGSQ